MILHGSGNLSAGYSALPCWRFIDTFVKFGSLVRHICSSWLNYDWLKVFVGFVRRNTWLRNSTNTYLIKLFFLSCTCKINASKHRPFLLVTDLRVHDMRFRIKLNFFFVFIVASIKELNRISLQMNQSRSARALRWKLAFLPLCVILRFPDIVWFPLWIFW